MKSNEEICIILFSNLIDYVHKSEVCDAVIPPPDGSISFVFLYYLVVWPNLLKTNLLYLFLINVNQGFRPGSRT